MMPLIPNLVRKSAFPGKPVCKWYHASALSHFVSFLHLLFKYNSTYGSIILQSNKGEDEETITLPVAPRPQPSPLPC